MYTGYFAQLKKYKEAGLIPVSICGAAPGWYDGYQFKVLAPRWAFFNEWKNGSHKGDNEYYIEHFKDEVLSKLNYQDVLSKLSNFGELDKLVLMCYEKPTDFCHRHLVSAWFRSKGIKCEEFNV